MKQPAYFRDITLIDMTLVYVTQLSIGYNLRQGKPVDGELWRV